MSIRLRFAPSPTGFLHVGGARTALYNWLYARKTGGKFILRIEDTDAERSSADMVTAILDGLRWLGLDWDEGPDKGGEYGPYFQSERRELYQTEAERLLADDRAYPCFCNEAELEKHRDESAYNGHCARLAPGERQAFLKEGRPHALRFRAPKEGETLLYDQIRGKMEFQNELFEDFVIIKSDGLPSYNFAVVVDDHAMEISHVVRGDDHISNTPRHLMLYEALGYRIPKFAHLPMILGEDKSRLSKRHGATSLGDFAGQGILPEGMMNYLALLGWSLDGKTEFFSAKKLVDAFSLKRVGSNPSVFDPEKLAWLSGEHFKRLDPKAKVEGCYEHLLSSGLELPPLEKVRERLARIVKLFGNRLKSYADALDLGASHFFAEFPDYDSEAVEEHLSSDSEARLQALADSWEKLGEFSSSELEASLRSLAESMGLGAADLIHPLRVALTGRRRSPDLFGLCEILGQEIVIARLRKQAWRK
ncbi:MAG: glutamate--tRNA ligase [Candidatus Krumholzibacteria bacterium]|nr:glutamate--tRNA ligase [Candidatus Krumholzibacteria bacterium]